LSVAGEREEGEAKAWKWGEEVEGVPATRGPKSLEEEEEEAPAPGAMSRGFRSVVRTVVRKWPEFGESLEP